MIAPILKGVEHTLIHFYEQALLISSYEQVETIRYRFY